MKNALLILTIMSNLQAEDTEVTPVIDKFGKQTSFVLSELPVILKEDSGFNIKLKDVSLVDKDKLIIYCQIQIVQNPERKENENKIFGKIQDISTIGVDQLVKTKNGYYNLETVRFRANSPNKSDISMIETNSGSVIDRASLKSYIEITIVDYSGYLAITGQNFKAGSYELTLIGALR